MSCFTFNCSAHSCGTDSNIKFLQFNQLRKKQKQKKKEKKKKASPLCTKSESNTWQSYSQAIFNVPSLPTN